MSQKAQKRIYFTPIILFCLLAAFFVSVGIYLQDREFTVERSKAENLSAQVVVNLQTMAAERHQALESLMQNWPTQEPNYLDWFNVQAITLLSIQRGYSSLMLIDSNGLVQWLVRPQYPSAPYWHDNIVGKSLELPDFLEFTNGEQYFSQLVSGMGGQHFLLYGRLISPQEPHLGYVLATFDLQAWLAMSNGQLVEQHYHFLITDSTLNPLTVGSNAPANVESFPVKSDLFNVLGRVWRLQLALPEPAFSGALLVSLVGLVMSLLATIVLYKLLKSAMNLDQSQLRYKTASEAALDALLIYKKVADDYFLVEANKIAIQLFQGDVCLIKDKPLSVQLKTFKQHHIVPRIDEVVLTGEPFDDYIEIKSRLIKPQWLKVQIVRAGKDIAITLRDVTERFNAQRALLRSEEKYRRLIDGLYRHFVYTKTLDQSFVYVSHGVQSILGINAEQFCLAQRRFMVESHADHRNIVYSIQSGENPQPYRLKLRAESGDTKVIEFADAGVFDEQGKLIAIEGIARDVTEEFALQEEVRYQASHDQLTGLMNRYAFDHYLTGLISKVNAGEASAVMCFIDMDRFKLVNDSCGHPAGDRLLKEVSNVFGEFVNEKDLLARIGGDEFCMIFRNLTLEQVLDKLDRLLQHIGAYRFTVEDKVFFVGASIGVIDIHQPGYSAADLIKAADNACYKAKSMGRNRYFVYTPTEEQQALDMVESKVLQHFQMALDNNGFELFFQPIIDLKSANQRTHGEVLLRLIGEDGQYISPGVFIPLAEQHGVMNKIDWWVVDNTLRFLQQQPAFCRQLDKIAINLSGITLSDEKLLKQIVHQIQCCNIPAEKLCFEITETSAVTNLSSAKWFIDELRALGCRFALDDFGAGMSTFTYLKNLDVDYVKIDGSFVRNMVRDKIDYETVKAINNIAQSMGKQTIAEFVVDDATREALIELGIDYGQGFALGYPEPLVNHCNLLQLVS
ncbi:EAL domain-containing protein [Alteromonas sp. AMM-1]|uniref:bifunctional diguanylate cyclase/phosphodiesterase n=1 Tax=Alteromonas sp. AMM-1 TaxID=3394233 RepID=UPI0039A7223C